VTYEVAEIRRRHNNIEAMDKWVVIDYVGFAKDAHRDRMMLLKAIDDLQASLLQLNSQSVARAEEIERLARISLAARALLKYLDDHDWGRIPEGVTGDTLRDLLHHRGETMSEQDIEREIQAKGLNAPRITPDRIDATIAGEAYHVFEGSCLTVCRLTLRNGFTVTGESACASPANFNAELGRKIAREHARDKIWALEGYLLREQLQAGQDKAA
jgi:N4 Gp49/Sf6 Gp66 family protein